ncbi:hypothetical protein AP9108_33045 [Arthrospira sp. PCC 9108]|nr:hypothetical protein AP9108_33045 [Arthrospira sp. PCC 9108]
MDLTLNEEDSVVNLDIDELETYIEGGAIKVQEPFVDAFEPGIGQLPFNQTI